MIAAIFLFAILGCLFAPKDKKKYKYEKRKKSRRKSSTWYDTLNDGDKDWLVSHYS